MTLPEAIHELRLVANTAEKTGVKRAVVAVKADVSSGYITMLLNGTRKLVGKKRLIKTIQKITLVYRRELNDKQADIKAAIEKLKK